MARKKVETRVSDTIPAPQPSQVLEAADLMNEGTGAPKQAYGFTIHLAKDAHAAAFLCGKTYDRSRTVETVVQRDHPALCGRCAALHAEEKATFVPQPMLERTA
jgi:hypothetical protein